MSDQEAHFYALTKLLENISQSQRNILEYLIVLGKKYSTIEVSVEKIALMAKVSEATVHRFIKRFEKTLVRVQLSKTRGKGNIYIFEPHVLKMLIFMHSKFKISRWTQKQYPVTYYSYEQSFKQLKDKNLRKSCEQKVEKNDTPKVAKMTPNLGFTSCLNLDKDLSFCFEQKGRPKEIEENKEMWFGILPKTYVGRNKIRDLENKYSPLALKMAISSYRQNYTLQDKEVLYPAKLFESVLMQKQQAILTF